MLICKMTKKEEKKVAPSHGHSLIIWGLQNPCCTCKKHEIMSNKIC